MGQLRAAGAAWFCPTGPRLLARGSARPQRPGASDGEVSVVGAGLVTPRPGKGGWGGRRASHFINNNNNNNKISKPNIPATLNCDEHAELVPLRRLAALATPPGRAVARAMTSPRALATGKRGLSWVGGGPRPPFLPPQKRRPAAAFHGLRPREAGRPAVLCRARTTFPEKRVVNWAKRRRRRFREVSVIQQ